MPIKTQLVDVIDLRFDPHNPRLPEDLEKTQDEIFRYIVDEIGVDDLIDSLSASGMIAADPVIARDALPDEEAGHLYVIEGNRRLAALKLLNGEKLAKKNDEDPEKSIPTLPVGIAGSIKTIKVQTGWPDDDLEAYLGYKHVTSSREWAPEAKARFVVERCKGDYSPDTLKKFARRLGTKVPTLKRWLVAHLTLKQAEKSKIFDPADTFSRRYFGTFYTLLGSQDVQTFLGLDDGLVNDPIPTKHIGDLRDFIKWSIGTASRPPVVDSRQQKKLAAVLSSPRALAYFRSKEDLDVALMYTEFNSTEIVDKLREATYAIEECLTMLLDVKDQPTVQAAIVDLDNAYRKLKHNSTIL
jgi:hypothetical protein